MSRVCRYCRQHFDSVFSLTNYCSNSCSWAATVEERKADDEKRAAEARVREIRRERESELNRYLLTSSGESSDKTPKFSVPEFLWATIVFGFVTYVMFVLPIKAFHDWVNDKCTGYTDERSIPAECKNRR